MATVEPLLGLPSDVGVVAAEVSVKVATAAPSTPTSTGSASVPNIALAPRRHAVATAVVMRWARCMVREKYVTHKKDQHLVIVLKSGLAIK